MKTISCESSFAVAGKCAAFAATVVLTLWGRAGGAIFNAASTTQTDVSNAVALAHDGDTVIVPAGTADWTTYLYVTNAITIGFAGVGQSIILDDIAYGNGGNPAYTQAVIALEPANTNIYLGCSLYDDNHKLIL
jgi:hypothetical protein